MTQKYITDIKHIITNSKIEIKPLLVKVFELPIHIYAFWLPADS
jgi:hypothetical protein